MTYSGPSSSILNNITRIAFLPCAIPYMVVLETAAPAVLKAVWSVVEPDFKESYHIIRGHSALCDVKKVVKASGTLESGGVVQRILFTIGEAYDLLTWWFFVAGVAKEFLVDWTSGILLNAQCGGDLLNCTSSSPAGATTDATQPENWFGFEWVTDMEHCRPRFEAGITIPAGGTGTLMANVQLKLADGTELPTEGMITDPDRGITYDHYNTATNSHNPTAAATLWYQHKNTSNQPKTIHFKCGCPIDVGGFHEAFAKHGTCHLSVSSR